MKHRLVFLFITVISTGVYTRTTFTKVRKYRANEIPDQLYKDDDKYTNAYLSKQTHVGIQHKKLFKVIDTPLELNHHYNRLLEVNLKHLINSAEMVYDESVEDFVDFSNEETNSAEIEENKSKKSYLYRKENLANVPRPNYEKDLKLLENNIDSKYENYEIHDVRIKRMSSATYEGRYKPQDINDVLKSIAVNNPQTKKQVHKNVKPESELAKSRMKRTNNIIEEENAVTTISVFKFTGRSTLFNQDLAFKNIHM